MRTNTQLSRRLRALARLVESIVAEAVPNLEFESRPFEAEQLREDGKNFVFALRDARRILKREGGAI